MRFQADPESPVTVDRVESPHGELVLRRVGSHFEIINNGVFLMDTRNGESERLLISEALRHRGGRVLIGGLGVGFSLTEALAHPGTSAVTVVERLDTIVEWHRGPLREVASGGLDDPRTRVVLADLVAWLSETDERFDAVCLDIDNGPDWTVVPGNDRLYSEEGVGLITQRLHDGGVLTVWSSHQAPWFVSVLRQHFADVTTFEVPVPRGQPDVVFVAADPLR